MSATATVRNILDSSKFATVCLRADENPEGFKISSLLGEDTGHDVFTPEGKKYSGSTYAAWESASFSGVFYIRKRIKKNTLSVVITNVSGRLNRDEATGFAVAASVAFLCEMESPQEMSEKDLAGWRIERAVKL
jgi:hypothetical protein